MCSDRKKTVRDFYIKTAQQWADTFYADDETQPVPASLMRMLPDSPRVLDLCCGAGYDAMRLQRMGAQVIGLDFSEASVDIARERNPDIPFVIGDMLEDYSAIGKVDAIVCVAGLVHLRTDQLRTAFRRMAQVIHPGGLVLLVVREGEGRVDHMSDVEIDGEQYDRAFYAHNVAELTAEAAGMFTFERLIDEPEPSVWINAVFRRA